MNNSPTRSFWLAFGCAVFAMFLIYSYSQEQKAIYDKRYGTKKTALVAAVDILEMGTLDETMVRQEELPAEFIQPGAAENPDDVVGLVASSPIKKGEQVLLTKLLSPGPNTGLSIQVAPDKRAIAIPVDEIRGVGKLLRPGDRVDILSTVSYGSGREEKREVTTLLQDVLILSTGLNVTNNIPRAIKMNGINGQPGFKNLNGDTGYSTVTIEVAPMEAQNLVYILDKNPGSLYLALRNGNDKTRINIPTATVDTVLGQQSELRIQKQIAKLQAKQGERQPAQAPVKKPTFVPITGSERK